jgi:hypothetical protein
MSEKNDALKAAAAVGGSVASAVGLIGLLSASLGLTAELALSIVSPVAAIAVGFGAKYVVDAVKRLQKTRHVFLSFSARDAELANTLRDELRRQSIKVWMAGENLVPGSDMKASIDAALSDSDSVVALLSDIESDWISYEIKSAREHHIPVVPVLTSRRARIPKELRNVASVDAVAQPDQVINRVVAAVQ